MSLHAIGRQLQYRQLGDDGLRSLKTLALKGEHAFIQLRLSINRTQAKKSKTHIKGREIGSIGIKSRVVMLHESLSDLIN
jgi:hypothetical protein